MEHLFRSYLELLQSILSNLSQLTKLVHRKIEEYRTYHNGAQTARGILEHNLREVDRVLAVLNADPAGNPGHVTQTPSSPSAKADFRV